MKLKTLNVDICHPKADAIIIPANLQGTMTGERTERVVKEGFKGIWRAGKKYLEEQEVSLGECFSTYPGRLNKRGVKKIYFAVIKRFQNDFTSIHWVKEAINKSFKKVIEDKIKTVAICGIGIDRGELDLKTVAYWTVKIAERYENQLEIKVVDENQSFINEVENLINKDEKEKK